MTTDQNTRNEHGRCRWTCGLLLVGLMGLSLLFFSSPALSQTVIDPEAYDFNFSKGLLAFGEERYDLAREFFSAALHAKPGDEDAGHYLGQSFIRLGQLEPAERVFREMLEANPQSGRALLGLGIVHYFRRQYDEALANLTAAESSLPGDALVHFYQGLVYHAQEDFDKSPGRFMRSMTLSRDLAPSAHYYTGIALLRQGLTEDAQTAFEEVLASGEPESELVRSARDYLAQAKASTPASLKHWNVLLSASLQYDTNVVLLPLGTQPPAGTIGISQKSDYRHILYLRGEYRPIQSDAGTAGAAYSVYQSFHSVLSNFDVENHTPTVFVQRQLGPLQARLQYTYDYVKVGQAPYLVAHSIQPLFTLSEGGHAYTQLHLAYQNKDFQDSAPDIFPQNSARDGKNWLIGVTQHLLFANNTGSARLGITYDSDRTGGGSPSAAVPGMQTNADWAYKGVMVSSGISLPPVHTLKLDLTFDYYRQRYDNPNSFSPDGSLRRRDDIYFLAGTLTRDLTRSLSLSFQYSYTRDQNNLSVFDYNRSVFSFVLAGHF